jgi:hypothetical protein
MWRILFSRYGIGVLLAVIVLGIVGAARLFSGPDSTRGVPGGAGVVVTVNPTADDDGEVSPPPVETPAISPGTAPPEKVAAAFAAAWLDHRGVSAARWLDRLRPHATPKLIEDLTGADPEGVPAERSTGPVEMVTRGETVIDASIPVDSGTLRLRLVAVDGRWFVDGVDWDRV